MAPQVGPLPAFAVGWLLAAVLGGGAAVYLMRRGGLDAYQIAVAFWGRVGALLLGSKLLYLIEAWPGWVSSPSAAIAALFSAQMRIPGGIALLFLMGPWLARISGIRYLWLADTIAPAGGLAVCGIRIGCFLEGCCHGVPSQAPWAVSFPPLTDAYAWQVQHGLIAPGAPATLPVHPLQLYFGMAGILMFVSLVIYQRYKRYDGEVVLGFFLLYLWSTYGLEFLRARPHELTHTFVFALALAATVVAASIEWRRRTQGHALAVLDA